MSKRIPPFIVFSGTGDDDKGGKNKPNPDEFLPGDSDLSDDDFKAKRGFPRNTKKDDMQPEERERYWRYESKKQQHRATTAERENAEWSKLGKRDEIQTALSDKEQQRRAGLDDNQKAVEDARNAGKSEATAAVTAKLLRPAIEGQVMGLTRTAGESIEDAKARVKGALEFADLTKFIGDDGELDADKIQTFAQSIAPTGSNDGDQGGDPLYQSLGREQMPPAGAAGSVAQYRKQAYDRRTPNKQQ